jgi:RNA polymerase sigma-70 factor (ECF subfamily)
MEDTRRTRRLEALVKRAQRGDRRAFDELCACYRSKLVRWICSLMSPELRSKIEPEDVLQETLVWAYRVIEKFEWRTEEALERWLFGIARHALLKEASRRNRGREYVIACEPPRDSPTPSRVMRRGDRFDRLQEALDGLSPDHRRVIELARLRGMPVKEIANRMQRSPDAVSQLLSRALKKLKDAFGDTESLGLPARSLEPHGGDDA